MKAQRDALEAHHKRLQREQDVARRVFDSVVHSRYLTRPHIKYLLSPMAIFNGDLLLAAPRRTGGLRVMVGDFTGHGLPAAIGTIPVADMFYAMTAKGYALTDLLDETNQKLKSILPPDLFLAACLLELDANYSTLTVWNGGIPDVLLCDAQARIRRRLVSCHLPLGVTSSTKLDRTLEQVEAAPGERVYLYTDGVIEACNPAGKLFGQSRLEACIQQCRKPEQRFDAICRDVAAFCAGALQRDDLTLMEIICDAALANAQDIPHEADRL